LIIFYHTKEKKVIAEIKEEIKKYTIAIKYLLNREVISSDNMSNKFNNYLF